MSWWKWSTTAASNATADPTINWSEGQSPSSVNDSARAEMAANAKYFLDQGGSLATAGTGTAFTLTTDGSFDTLAHLDGRSIAFTPHTTCGATVTLNVDGLGAKPLRSSPGIELPSGLLIQGTPYRALYNNSDGAFYLHGFYSLPYAIPIGGMMPYVSSSAPNSSFALPFGQAISRTTYAALFALVGTTFGSGDGSTTFNILDLRGRSIFGLDNMGGSAASRITVAGGNFAGTTLGATGGAENHTLSINEIPSHNHNFNDPGHSHGGGQASNQSTQWGTAGGGGTGWSSSPGSTSGAGTGITFNAQGGGAAHTILPPAMTLPFILRVI